MVFHIILFEDIGTKFRCNSGDSFISRLMLAFMIPTWFLSMWISNTAASVMMMPIAVEVVDKLKRRTLGEKTVLERRNGEIDAQVAGISGERSFSTCLKNVLHSFVFLNIFCA